MTLHPRRRYPPICSTTSLDSRLTKHD